MQRNFLAPRSRTVNYFPDYFLASAKFDLLMVQRTPITS